MHGSTIRSADATRSCPTLRASHHPTDGTMPSAIHIGGATAREITRVGPGAVPVVVAAVAEANRVVVAAVAVAAVGRIPAAARTAVVVRTPVEAARLLRGPTPEKLIEN